VSPLGQLIAASLALLVVLGRPVHVDAGSVGGEIALDMDWRQPGEHDGVWAKYGGSAARYSTFPVNVVHWFELMVKL
jgi:hypothetical protein